MQREDGASLVGFDTDEVEHFFGLGVAGEGGHELPRSWEGCAVRLGDRDGALSARDPRHPVSQTFPAFASSSSDTAPDEHGGAC
jgi:hypothetical protein